MQKIIQNSFNIDILVFYLKHSYWHVIVHATLTLFVITSFNRPATFNAATAVVVVVDDVVAATVSAVVIAAVVVAAAVDVLFMAAII